MRDFFAAGFIIRFIYLSAAFCVEEPRRRVENTKEATHPNPLRTFHGAVGGPGCQQRMGSQVGGWRGGSPSSQAPLFLEGKKGVWHVDDRMRVDCLNGGRGVGHYSLVLPHSLVVWWGTPYAARARSMAGSDGFEIRVGLARLLDGCVRDGRTRSGLGGPWTVGNKRQARELQGLLGCSVRLAPRVGAGAGRGGPGLDQLTT